MALESFYGGKQGVSPVIKARFKYVNTEDPAYKGRLERTTTLTKEEANWLNDFFNVTSYVEDSQLKWSASTLKPFTMDECLKSVNYTDVWYGELCIIDTDSKMNSNNGKIYRRTLKQQENNNKAVNTDDTLYAEYVGQIVGPTGGIPKFDFGSLDLEREKAIGESQTYSSDVVPLDNSSWDYSYIDNTSKKITSAIPETIDDIAILDSGNSANIQIVPGKIVDDNNNEQYNDKFRYTWCNVRRKEDGEDSDAWVYLGFEIPYSWFDVERTEIQYWDSRENLLEHTQKGTDNQEHPFYHNLHFYIPRGTRGIGPEELFIVGKDNKNKPETLYDFDAITYNQGTDTYSIDTSKVKNPTEKTYWVAKWRLYNPKTTDVTDIYQYIGAYKDINAVQLLNTGELQVRYSDSETWTTLNTLKWIKSVTINTNISSNDYGKFEVQYNDQSSSYQTRLPLIKSADYNQENGKIIFGLATGGALETEKSIKDITDIQICKDSNKNSINSGNAIIGHLYIKYRGDTNYTDLGQVNGNSVVGIVYTLSGTYSDTNTPREYLNNATYNENESTSIGSNGRIKVNNTEVTGGLVAATVQDGVNSSPYTAIYYYKQSGSQGEWAFAGTIGNTSGSNGSNVFVQIETSNNPSSTVQYPEDYQTVQKPEFYIQGQQKECESINFEDSDFSLLFPSNNG